MSDGAGLSRRLPCLVFTAQACRAVGKTDIGPKPYQFLPKIVICGPARTYKWSLSACSEGLSLGTSLHYPLDGVVVRNAG